MWFLVSPAAPWARLITWSRRYHEIGPTKNRREIWNFWSWFSKPKKSSLGFFRWYSLGAGRSRGTPFTWTKMRLFSSTKCSSSTAVVRLHKLIWVKYRSALVDPAGSHNRKVSSGKLLYMKQRSTAVLLLDMEQRSTAVCTKKIQIFFVLSTLTANSMAKPTFPWKTIYSPRWTPHLV